jgi:hypothetical protein
MTHLRAKSSFSAGARRIVHAGDVLDANDPIIKGREALFESLDAVKPEPVTRANAATKIISTGTKARKGGRAAKAPSGDDG